MFDVRTLLWCYVFVNSFLGVALVFYRSRQKTYAGYDLWTCGTVLLALGYLLFVLREWAIPLWASIVFANASVALGAVLRLDGISRFIRTNAVFRTWYLLPALLAAVCGYFYFIDDNIGIRTLVIVSLLSIVIFRMAGLFLAGSNGGRNGLLVAVGTLYALLGFAFVARFLSMQWLSEWNMFKPFASNVMFFSVGLVIEIGISLSYFMMQSQRLESDLKLSHRLLQETNAQLVQKISEIKVLSGLLPICMYCKKIQDNQGEWHHVEVYVSRQTDAEFSHGICPACLEAQHPHFAMTRND